jgi:hypothetical protein
MAKYSTPADRALRVRVVSMATWIDIPVKSAMHRGPASLQNRSIRRICEFSADAVLSVFWSGEDA